MHAHPLSHLPENLVGFCCQGRPQVLHTRVGQHLRLAVLLQGCGCGRKPPALRDLCGGFWCGGFGGGGGAGQGSDSVSTQSQHAVHTS